MNTCIEIKDLAFPIKLEYYGGKSERYKVTYGEEVHKNLVYKAAALELGCAIMHALACDGKLNDN